MSDSLDGLGLGLNKWLQMAMTMGSEPPEVGNMTGPCITRWLVLVSCMVLLWIHHGAFFLRIASQDARSFLGSQSGTDGKKNSSKL